jgi:hypothetical protein
MVIINKNGIVKSEKGKTLTGKKLIAALSDTVQVAKGVTIGDLFLLAKPIIRFIGPYSWCMSYKAFYKELNKDNPDKIDKHEIMEFYWYSRILMINSSNEFEMSPSFHILKKEQEPYSSQFLPIYKMKDLKVVLNTKLTIHEMSLKQKKLRNKILVETHREFTLLEILHTVFYNISFYGSPRKRDKFVKEILGGKDA